MRTGANIRSMIAKVRDLWRYGIASIAALIIDIATFDLSLKILHWPWFWAAVVGFLFGAGVAYLLSVKWVFSSRVLKRQPVMEMAIFVVIGAMGLVVTEVVMLIFMEKLGLAAEPSKLTASVVSFGFNYLVRKSILFSGGFAKKTIVDKVAQP